MISLSQNTSKSIIDYDGSCKYVVVGDSIASAALTRTTPTVNNDQSNNNIDSSSVSDFCSQRRRSLDEDGTLDSGTSECTPKVLKLHGVALSKFCYQPDLRPSNILDIDVFNKDATLATERQMTQWTPTHLPSVVLETLSLLAVSIFKVFMRFWYKLQKLSETFDETAATLKVNPINELGATLKGNPKFEDVDLSGVLQQLDKAATALDIDFTNSQKAKFIQERNDLWKQWTDAMAPLTNKFTTLTDCWNLPKMTTLRWFCDGKVEREITKFVWNKVNELMKTSKCDVPVNLESVDDEEPPTVATTLTTIETAKVSPKLTAKATLRQANFGNFFGWLHLRPMQLFKLCRKYHVDVNTAIKVCAAWKWCTVPLYVAQHEIFSSQVHVLGGIVLSPAEKRLLAKGTTFIPTPPPLKKEQMDNSVFNHVSSATTRIKMSLFSRMPPLTSKRKVPFRFEDPWIDDLQDSVNSFSSNLQSSDVHRNLAREEVRALNGLLERTDIAIIPSDKNMGIAVLPISLYISLMEVEIDKLPQTFAPLNTPLPTLWSARRMHLDLICDKLRTTNWSNLSQLIKAIQVDLDGPLMTPHIYGLPKVHKKVTSMRLIVPATNHPLRNLHKFLALALDPFVSREQFVITHSLEALELFVDVPFDKDWFFFKADIVAMYPNVHLPHAIQVAAELLSTSKGSDGLSKKWWMMILKWAHFKLEFQWREKYFYFKNGVPIGSPSGPQIAILALHDVIRPKLEKLQSCFKVYGAYFDDHFGICSVDPAEILKQLIPDVNQPYLRFEEPMEIIQLKDLVKSGKAVDILDIALWPSVNEEGRIVFEPGVYTKPMGAYQYVPWTSAHTPAVKRAVPRGETCRRLRIATSSSLRTKTLVDLAVKLSRRGYPKDSILRCLTKGIPSREGILKKIKRRRQQAHFPWICEADRTNTSSVPPDSAENSCRSSDSKLNCFGTSRTVVFPLILPYDPRRHKMDRELRDRLQELWNNNVRCKSKWEAVRVVLAYRKGRSLGDRFRRFSSLNCKHSKRT